MARQTKLSPSLAMFRPVAADATRDFTVDAETARRLYDAGLIARDLTNGGFCPGKNGRPENRWQFDMLAQGA